MDDQGLAVRHGGDVEALELSDRDSDDEAERSAWDEWRHALAEGTYVDATEARERVAKQRDWDYRVGVRLAGRRSV